MVENTQVQCPVCKVGIILKDSELVQNRPYELMIFGPGGEDNYREAVKYYCGNERCKVTFAGLPVDSLQNPT